MSEDSLLKRMELIRSRTIKSLDATSENDLDVIPTGFNNSIRWNLGHVLFVQERLSYSLAGEQQELPDADKYSRLFANGTKPADWTEKPPSVHEIRELLIAQSERIFKKFQSRLDEKIAKPFLEFETIGECIEYSLYHEGVHTGAIGGLKKAIIGQGIEG